MPPREREPVSEIDHERATTTCNEQLLFDISECDCPWCNLSRAYLASRGEITALRERVGALERVREAAKRFFQATNKQPEPCDIEWLNEEFWRSFDATRAALSACDGEGREP